MKKTSLTNTQITNTNITKTSFTKTHFTKITFAVIVCVILLTGILTACSSNTKTQNETTPKDEKTETLSRVWQVNEGTVLITTDETIVDKFNNAQNNLETEEYALEPTRLIATNKNNPSEYLLLCRGTNSPTADALNWYLVILDASEEGAEQFSVIRKLSLSDVEDNPQDKEAMQEFLQDWGMDADTQTGLSPQSTELYQNAEKAKEDDFLTPFLCLGMQEGMEEDNCLYLCYNTDNRADLYTAVVTTDAKEKSALTKITPVNLSYLLY